MPQLAWRTPLPRRPRKARTRPRAHLHVEELEARWTPSLAGCCPPAAHDHAGAAALEHHGSGPAIRLDLVGLHEFGHALGLPHTEDPRSIMYPFYNPNYNKDNLANDSIVPVLQALYADPDSGPWKDSFDVHPLNGVVEITFSFTPDGAVMETDAGPNTLFSTMESHFGSGWQNILRAELNRWATVSVSPLGMGTPLAFFELADGGQPFGVLNEEGAAQNDPRFGDIRIGAHTMDGAGGELAHAYLPTSADFLTPFTDPGDVHFDNAENWAGESGGTGGGKGSGKGGGNGGGKKSPLMIGEESRVAPVAPVALVDAHLGSGFVLEFAGEAESAPPQDGSPEGGEDPKAGAQNQGQEKPGEASLVASPQTAADEERLAIDELLWQAVPCEW